MLACCTPSGEVHPMSTDLFNCLSSVSCLGAGTSDEKNSSAVQVWEKNGKDNGAVRNQAAIKHSQYQAKEK